VFSSAFVVRSTAGVLHGAGHEFGSVSVDSRTLEAGALYVALIGERHDGHDFAAAAVERGATGVLTARRLSLPAGVCQIVVPDTLVALQALAAAHRARFAGPVVAITGSNGKTTTKGFAAGMFAAAYGEDAVLATRGNLNNHIGVPLTLLELRPRHRVAVVEMGMNHFGEIALLTGLARPQAALITNAGPAHLEGVGSLAGVAKAKGEIFEGLQPDGMAILNRDDAFYAYWHVIARDHRQISFGFGAEAQVRGRILPNGELEATTPRGVFSLRLPLPGQHNALNALAVIAVGEAFALDHDAIARGIAGARVAAGRLERLALAGGLLVIDDSYNANPASMLASIALLAAEPAPRFLVLGDMAELGAHTKAGHRSVAEAALASDIEFVLTCGPLMRNAFTDAAGRPGTVVAHFASHEALTTALLPLVRAGGTVLVKGSRSSAMERVVRGLEAAIGRRV